jgi:hypothetical protein
VLIAETSPRKSGVAGCALKRTARARLSIRLGKCDRNLRGQNHRAAAVGVRALDVDLHGRVCLSRDGAPFPEHACAGQPLRKLFLQSAANHCGQRLAPPVIRLQVQLIVLGGADDLRWPAKGRRCSPARDPDRFGLRRQACAASAAGRSLLLGFAGAFRRSELVRIRVGDLTFGQPGLSVLLPRSNTDQKAKAPSSTSPPTRSRQRCPVAALRAWHGWRRPGSRMAGIPADHPRRRGRTPSPLRRERVRLILKERAWEAGFRDAALVRITPHSLRAGCITTLAQASVHERDIMQHSRHGSQTVVRSYIRAAAAEEAFTSGALWRRKDA